MSAPLLEDGRAYGTLNERQAEAVRRIRRRIRTSVQLMDDLLELARTEAGQIELQWTVVGLCEAAREIAEEFQAQAAVVGVELVLAVPGDVRVHAEPMRLRQILANLVSNAIMYAPGGRATIHAAPPRGGPQAQRLAISVIDSGPGIPEEKREFIFEEYTRLKPGAQQGSGIGLAISRRVARLMQATSRWRAARARLRVHAVVARGSQG